MSPTIARIFLRIVGAVIVVCAAIGLLFNANSFFAIASGTLEDAIGQHEPYLYEAFYTLSAVCVICYLALALCGIQFIRLSTSLFWLLALTFSVEAVAFFGTGRLWAHPVYGDSVAAASGIALGGLMPQFFIFLPLWAPILVWVSRRSLAR